ncbi:hypothetical protein C8J56DRAFT_350300 [Mycena floridula]|nr:hypothetical protein C8J56DRAFT_350300 [Mycena floridula]
MMKQWWPVGRSQWMEFCFFFHYRKLQASLSGPSCPDAVDSASDIPAAGKWVSDRRFPSKSIPDSILASVLAVLMNIFWFISLALSLTCALAVTLIQQWASKYIHAIKRRQVPEMRGRIRAFLFEGIESSRGFRHSGRDTSSSTRFAVLLLRWPCLLLHPINSTVTYLMSGLLIACGTAYFYATIVPLISIASPTYSYASHNLHLPIPLHTEYASDRDWEKLETDCLSSSDNLELFEDARPTLHIPSASASYHVDDFCRPERSLTTFPK